MNTFPVARLKNPFVHPTGFRAMGQEASPVSTVAPMTEEQMVAEKNRLLRAAAAEIIKSANEVASNLDTTYNSYANFTRNSWVRTAVSNAILPMIGPYIDAWLRSDQAGRAVATIQAGNVIANRWMNKVRSDFLPAFIEDIADMDEPLAGQVDAAYEKVASAYRRNVDLMVGFADIPQVILGRAEQQFFGGLSVSVPKAFKNLQDIAVSLNKLQEAGMKGLKATARVLEKAAGVAGAASDAADKAPWLVIAGLGIIGVWLLVK